MQQFVALVSESDCSWSRGTALHLELLTDFRLVGVHSLAGLIGP